MWPAVSQSENTHIGSSLTSGVLRGQFLSLISCPVGEGGPPASTMDQGVGESRWRGRAEDYPRKRMLSRRYRGVRDAALISAVAQDGRWRMLRCGNRPPPREEHSNLSLSLSLSFPDSTTQLERALTYGASNLSSPPPLGNKIQNDWGDSNRELYLNIQKNGKFPKIFPRNEKMRGMLRWRSE